jgi:hypothetical protein
MTGIYKKNTSAWMAKNRETVLFTVSREVAAIAQASSCEACNPDGAEFPFEGILDNALLFTQAH